MGLGAQRYGDRDKGTGELGYGDVRFGMRGGQDLGMGGQEDVGQRHWGRGDRRNGNTGTQDLGHNGDRRRGTWGQGEMGTGGGGHRDTAADLPALTPDPQHHGCRGGDTDGAAGAEGDTATSGVGTAAVPPSVTRPLLGAPCFTFSSRGGCSAPLGGGNAPHPPSPSVPTGVVALEVAVPPRRGTWPHGGGGGLLSPKAGGRGGATVASVSPPLHVPPLNPPFWVTSGRGRQSVTPRWGGRGDGGGVGGTPQNRALIASEGNSPPPTLCIGG